MYTYKGGEERVRRTVVADGLTKYVAHQTTRPFLSLL